MTGYCILKTKHLFTFKILKELEMFDSTYFVTTYLCNNNFSKLYLKKKHRCAINIRLNPKSSNFDDIIYSLYAILSTHFMYLFLCIASQTFVNTAQRLNTMCKYIAKIK